MFTFQYAKNPFYQTEDHSCIHITVKWAEFNEEHPFGAMATDVEAHGRDLYTRAIAGEFGEIGAYVPPTSAPNQPQTQGSQTL
jgi:hypothetical protein